MACRITLYLRECIPLYQATQVPELCSSYDAVIYARAFSGRMPGTHTLNLMEDADHNFTGRQDEVVELILEWWATRQSRELKTGIWLTGTRGKL